MNYQTRTEVDATNPRLSHMISVMQDGAAAGGSVTEDDLRAAGFSTEEIASFAPEAARKAAEEHTRRVA